MWFIPFHWKLVARNYLKLNQIMPYTAFYIKRCMKALGLKSCKWVSLLVFATFNLGKYIRYWNWIFRNAFALLTDLLVLFIHFTTNWRVQVSTTLLDFPSRWILILEWYTNMFTFFNVDLVHSYFRNAYRWYFHDSILDITYWVGN